MPTAAGKTAILDIAVFTLAAEAARAVEQRSAPLRIFFVIDRRIVVDEAYRRACSIAERVNGALAGGDGILRRVAQSLARLSVGEPLYVSIMRGGVYRDNRWARSPTQPTICVSTVDQLGSRLLFRGYGLAARAMPIQAGLIANDSMIVLDEVHLSRPFEQTLTALQRYRAWGTAPVSRPLSVVRMSATPAGPESTSFTATPEDLEHPVLGKRIIARKMARLELVEGTPLKQELSREHARRLRQENRDLMVRTIHMQARELLNQAQPPVVTAIVVNRVATARNVFELLRGDMAGEAVLLTGRVRPYDRDLLLEQILPRVRAGRTRDSVRTPLSVVATQCVEVGADFDFDALITECAPLDALRQRLGRLDRLGELGESRVIVLTSKGDLKSEDPIYGTAVSATWRWLNDNFPKRKKGKPLLLDLGTASVNQLCKKLSAARLEELRSPAVRAPVMLPAHLDLWVQTSPFPGPDPEPALFLHGPEPGSPDVQIVWRSDLDRVEPDADTWSDCVSLLPPLTDEALPIPIYAASAWLAGAPSPEVADAEGSGTAFVQPTSGDRLALRWRGPEDSDLVAPAELRPGDTIVVPSSYGGCDRFGWNPESSHATPDIADEVYGRRRKSPVLRSHPAVLSNAVVDGATLDPTILPLLRTALEAIELDEPEEKIEAAIDAYLAAIAASAALRDSVRSAAQALLQGHFKWTLYPSEDGLLLEAREGPVGLEFTDEDETSCMTRQVTLANHSAGVRDYARRFAEACGLSPALADDLALAGWLHDVGKADRRFQIILHRGSELEFRKTDELLAKSGMDPRDRRAWRSARERSGYPQGARHECQSVALVQSNADALAAAHDRELVLYLIGAHHGVCRPFAPMVSDPSPIEVSLRHGDCPLRASSAHELQRLDSGVIDRFWSMIRKYGWFGLAYLEAILRLADHRQSDEEQRGE